MNILAIDLGSTSFKAGVVDRRGKQVSAGSANLRYRYAAGGKVELDVAGVEGALRRAIRQALRGMGRIGAIAVTSQAQTFTTVDGCGRMKRPFVSWQDVRAGEASRQLQKALPDFARHCSFATILPALQVCQLRHVPVPRGERVFGLPGYFVWRWTGEAAVDNNLAAMSGLYSLANGDWWPEALRACGLRPEQLGRVIPVGAVAGSTGDGATAYGLPAGIPVVLAGNDQTSGAYAARLDQTGALLLTMGTAQVVYACEERLPAARGGSVRGPYPGGRFYRMAADSGGNVINWAKTVLSGCATDERFFRRAAQAPAGCHGLRFEVTPDVAAGTWRDVGLEHTTADLARSVIEGLCRRMAELVRLAAPDCRRRRVVAAGGGSRQPLWVEALSAELNVRIRPIQAQPLLGAARMAANAERG